MTLNPVSKRSDYMPKSTDGLLHQHCLFPLIGVPTAQWGKPHWLCPSQIRPYLYSKFHTLADLAYFKHRYSVSLHTLLHFVFTIFSTVFPAVSSVYGAFDPTPAHDPIPTHNSGSGLAVTFCRSQPYIPSGEDWMLHHHCKLKQLHRIVVLCLVFLCIILLFLKAGLFSVNSHIAIRECGERVKVWSCRGWGTYQQC